MGDSASIDVLHVEDDPAFADISKRLLERNGELSVCTEHDPETAFERWESEEFDCIVSDYDMPGMDGIDLLEAVRGRDADVPFILYTGRGSEEVAGEALAADATGYLQKNGPESAQLLHNRIRRAVSEYRVATTYDEYRTIVDSLSDPVYVLDEAGKFTFVNQAFVEMVGFDREALLGSDVSLIKSNGMVDRAEKNLGTVLSESGPDASVFEIEITTADGGTLVCEDHIGVLPFDGTEFAGSAGVLQNVDDRRKLEERALFLEEVVDSVGVGVAVYDADGSYEYANEAYASLLGTTVETVLGSKVWTYSAELDADRFDDYWASYRPGETREHETIQRRADGATVAVRATTTHKRIEETSYHFGTVQPIDAE